MSYAILPYSFPEGVLTGMLRKRADDDEAAVNIRNRIVERFPDDFSSHNEYFQKEIREGDPYLEDALLDLMHGRFNLAPAYTYAYAFEMFCKHLGKIQWPCNSLSSTNTAVLKEFDEKLRKLDVPDECLILSLLERTTPWLEPSLDFPVVALLDNDFIQKHKSQINGSWRKAGDPEIKKILGSMNTWFKSKDMILFYY